MTRRQRPKTPSQTTITKKYSIKTPSKLKNLKLVVKPIKNLKEINSKQRRLTNKCL